MVYFTVSICHTHMYSSDTDIVYYFIYFLLRINEQIYKK